MTVCKPCEAHDLKHDRGKKSVTTYSIASVNITLLKYDVLRSVDLWIKGSVKSRAFLLRCDASLPPAVMRGGGGVSPKEDVVGEVA